MGIMEYRDWGAHPFSDVRLARERRAYHGHYMEALDATAALEDWGRHHSAPEAYAAGWDVATDGAPCPPAAYDGWAATVGVPAPEAAFAAGYADALASSGRW